ncbi:protein ALTERED PHOSPHATE STARVATION RESPONSE 1 [Cornus florida]|uniref:protein ALTERED PHOSPHATE STARVATION RESPONSE 1 n=1 Tax=Cornus florida TaxID=4283 RepID=UPI00289F54B3|nr:protein ALTERED PHOSPHATE STARVATION RESPONSE 1 [Cornus florida]
MGSASSKAEKSEALRLCKERKKFIKQAIDSRYALASAHVAYLQSLRNIGILLRRFVEAQVLIESSLSPPATEIDKTPIHLSYTSPSPHNESFLSLPVPKLSYMRSGGTNAVTVRFNLTSTNSFMDDSESMPFTMPPPPPPPPHPESGSSWDFFDPYDDCEGSRFVGEDGLHVNFDHIRLPERPIRTKIENEEYKVSSDSETHNDGRDQWTAHIAHSLTPQRIKGGGQTVNSEAKQLEAEQNVSVLAGTLIGKAAFKQSSSKTDESVVDKDMPAERGGPSEFITHRAQDFQSSIKDIEQGFFRASESGKEISRMLEVNKLRFGYSEAKEPPQHVIKVIDWNRSTSSRSSSSSNPIATVAKENNDDSGNDLADEFGMIAGSNSSTLDRLYAWERKLFDEVKASESVRKEYDGKCDQLRQQFAKDLSAQVIDKTRAVAKDLHSQVGVALHAVDSISKRIEKMRDEELQPQLVELIQGLIRMWKAMHECHHAQYITISLAYDAKSSSRTPHGDMQRQISTQLQHEIECFGLSFADWINSNASYVEAVNGWLQKCILQPQERSKGRRAFSPRRVLAPPIFVLCREWSAGIKALPSHELSDAIKALFEQVAELEKKQRTLDSSNTGELQDTDDDMSSNLSCTHTSLTKVLDRLTKFSEASLKMYEDIRQKSETARNAYLNYRPPRF